MKIILCICCLVIMSCGTDTSKLEAEVEGLKTETERLSEKVDSLEKRLCILEENESAKNNKINVKSSKRTANNIQIKKTRTSGNSNTVVSGGRCQAITKKGTQCKRNAESGRIYC